MLEWLDPSEWQFVEAARVFKYYLGFAPAEIGGQYQYPIGYFVVFLIVGPLTMKIVDWWKSR